MGRGDDDKLIRWSDFLGGKLTIFNKITPQTSDGPKSRAHLMATEYNVQGGKKDTDTARCQGVVRGYLQVTK